MLVVNGSVHREEKVEAPGVSINHLVRDCRAQARQWQQDQLRRLLEEVQEAHLRRVFAAEETLVCTRCGLIHCGGADLLRRGWRSRRVLTEEGPLDFALRQITCRGCRRTWSPYPELLGLRRGARVLEEVQEKLVGLVTQMSYAGSCALLEEWRGARVSPRSLHRWVQEKGAALEFGSEEPAEVVVADGTRIPAGTRAAQEDLRVGFALVGRTVVQGRPRACLRVCGVGIGLGSWAEALPKTLQPRQMVTDAEGSLRAYVREHFPQARHQLCEWHVVYTLDWSLIEDGVKVKQRRAWQHELNAILFDARTPEQKRQRYTELTERIGKESPRAQKQLRAAADLILYEEPSVERTTSLAERQMREINRRIENGARWSAPGALHLTKLRLARMHNPEDYDRLWMRN